MKVRNKKYQRGGPIDYTGMGIGFMNNKKIYQRGDHKATLWTKLNLRNTETIPHGDWARYYGGYPLTGKSIDRWERADSRTYDLQYSNYAPSNAKDSNVKYIANKDPKFVSQILQYYNENYKGKPLRTSYGYNPQKKGDYKTYNTFGDLGSFKIDVGEDKKGKYVSYYDKWNYRRSDNPDVNKTEWLGAVKPYEVYDRIYLNDNKEQKAMGGKLNIKKQPQNYGFGGILQAIAPFANLIPIPGLNTAIAGGLGVAGGMMEQQGDQNRANTLTMEQQQLATARTGNMATTPIGQPTFPYGGQTPGVTPVELEQQEVFQTPDGQMGQVDGPSHEQGGVDMNLPGGTFVWSDKLKASTGRTFAEEAAYLGRLKAKYEKILNS